MPSGSTLATGSIDIKNIAGSEETMAGAHQRVVVGLRRASFQGAGAGAEMVKPLRLAKARDFAAVRREGRARSDGLLVVVARLNRMSVSRVGFSVGKRVGNAVVRNRIKRRLREAVRLAPVEEGWDLVVIARKGASSAEFQRLSRSLASLLGQAGALSSPPKATSEAIDA